MQRDLKVNIDADPKGFNRGTQSAAAAAKRLEEALARQEAKQAAAGRSAALMRGELVSLAAAAAAMSPAFVAAGAGAVSFGALAAPAILKVIEAQKEMGEQWDTLSVEQKVSASGLRDLISRYKELAKSVEPEVLQTFNAGLGVVDSLLPRLAPLTRAVAKELTNFAHSAEDALNSDRAEEFFSFLEQQAGPMTAAFGDALGSGVGAAASLTEALMPLATAGLGVVSMAADLVAVLSDMNPELAQAAVLMFALRAPLGGLGDMVGKTSGRYKAFSVANKEASTATKLLNLATSAGPNLYLAAGTAIAFFAVKALTAKTSAQELADTINKSNQAVGNNLAGYTAANRALDAQLRPSTQRAADATRTLTGDVNMMNVQLYQGAQAANAMTREWVSQTKAINSTKYNNVVQGAQALGRVYGLTADQAISLADAVGVDLSGGILENGQVAAGTIAKMEAYRAAVEAARNPTAVVAQAWRDAGNEALALKDRVNAVSTALDAYFNPALNVLSATNQMKDALAASNRVLRDGNSSALERSRALESQLAPMGRWINAQIGAKRSVSLTDKALRNQFPSLIRLSQGSAVGQRALDGLVHSMQGTITRAKGATTIVDRYGNQIRILPNGKTTVIKANAGEAQAKLLAVWNAVHKIPPSKATAVKANTGQATSAIAGVRAGLNSLQSKTLTITTYFRQIGQQANAAPRTARASGGPIDGPGTETSDSIPVWLSRNEYVINAKQTRRYLPIIEAINAGRYAAGGMVGYASGGQVDVPISEFVQRFMGSTASRSDLNSAVRARKDAVDQLLRAQRKLAEDRRKDRSARTIADSEARVAKERRDLSAVTDKLTLTEARYKKGKITAVQKLSAGLIMGIKNTGAFIKNITKLADMGFGPLAQQLLNAGGPEAEAMAASAVKLSASKLKSLNAKVVTAAGQQARLQQLPNILKVKAAQKGGAKTVAALVRATGLSEDELAEANAVGHLFAAGGIMRYAAGGWRPGPGVATRPTVLFGEGKGPEAYIPYDPAHRARAAGLVQRVASDFGMGGGTVINLTVQGAIDPIGTARTVETALRKLVRTNGRVALNL